jgi:hypothetical protein
MMLMLLMLSTYFLWDGVGTFEREWVWLQIAAQNSNAIADSEPKFVVTAWAAKPLAYPGSSLAPTVAVRQTGRCVRCRFSFALTRCSARRTES